MCNIAVGAGKALKEAGLYVLDVVMVSVDTALIVDELIAFQLGTKTAFSSIGWQEKSATGQAYYDSSWSEIFGNAGRVGWASGTLGVSEIVAGLWQYGQDGDVDVFQQHMGGVAAGNAVAAVGAKVTGANPRFDFKAKAPKSTPKTQATPSQCFLAGTLVSRFSAEASDEREMIPIEEIRSGDAVWSCDSLRGNWHPKSVIETLIHQFVGDIITIRFEGGMIESTGGHPIWVVSGENLENRPRCEHVYDDEHGMFSHGRWVNARDLRIGDELLSRNDRKTKVLDVQSRSEVTTVYNLTVADYHTYAVGNLEFLVHNKAKVASVPKSESTVWKNLKPFRGKTKTNGLSGKNKRFYEWDHTHMDIEVYDSKMKHLGSMDPRTGAPVQRCPCPTSVRRVENEERDAETGGKMNEEFDDNSTERGESEK